MGVSYKWWKPFTFAKPRYYMEIHPTLIAGFRYHKPGIPLSLVVVLSVVPLVTSVYTI